MGETEWRTCLRVLVVAAAGDGVLLTGSGELPSGEVPGRLWPGDTGEMLEAARAVLGAEVAMLRAVHEGDVPADHHRSMLMTAVLRGDPPAGLGWGRVPAEHAALVVEATGPQVPKHPWAHRDWLPATEAWLRSAVAATGRTVTGPVEQRRVWDLSSVLRVPTDRGDIYLKSAVAAPLFVDEVSVTAELARLFPGRVPDVVAADPERKLLALADHGPDVGWEAPLEVWEEVVRKFGRLQVASVPHVAELRAAGCLDRGLEWLAAQLPRFFRPEVAGRYAPLELVTRLEAAVPRLVALCGELAAYGLPTTLAHGDMHLGNVARGPAGYVFYDWTDAAVGHPFLDLIAIDQVGEERDRLRDAYLSEWAGLAPPDRLRKAWPLVEVLSPANQAISYLSLGLYLGGDEPSQLFGDYPVEWLEKVLSRLR